jgi:hypothetical protein
LKGRTVKKVLESKPEGSIKRGRTTLRWLEDLRERKVKGWRQKAVGREEWASVTRQAKAFREGRTAEQ